MSRNQKKEQYRPKSAIECKVCGDIIYSKTEGEFTGCSCYNNNKGKKGIYIDETIYYVRTGGNSENVIYHDYEQIKSRIQEHEAKQSRVSQQSRSKGLKTEKAPKGN